MILAPFSRFNVFNQQKSDNKKNTQQKAVLKHSFGKKQDDQPKVSECGIYDDDIFRYLISKEKKFVLPIDFMDGSELTSRMRLILVDWIFQIQNKYGGLPETVHLSICIVDQILATKSVKKSDFQLLGVAALYVAHKFEEVSFPHIEDFEYWTLGTYTRKQIFEMERNILNQIQFDLTCPSPFVYARCLGSIIRDVLDSEPSFADHEDSYKVSNMTKYFVELALLDATTCSIPKSGIAVAAVMMSLTVCNIEKSAREKIESEILKKVELKKDEANMNMNIVANAILSVMKQPKNTSLKDFYGQEKTDCVTQLASQRIDLIKIMAENLEMKN